jgi:hypothetical protein
MANKIGQAFVKKTNLSNHWTYCIFLFDKEIKNCKEPFLRRSKKLGKSAPAHRLEFELSSSLFFFSPRASSEKIEAIFTPLQSDGCWSF